MAKATTEERTCSRCREIKPVAQFHRDSTRRYQRYCKPCRAQVGRNSHERRAVYLKYKYGLTQETFDQLLSRQKGKCALCKNPFTESKLGYIKPRVDHDHMTGKVRGLLCHSCNIGLAFYENFVMEHETRIKRYLEVN